MNNEEMSAAETILKRNVNIIGILRGIGADFFGQVMPTAFAAGLNAIEITMNTPDAARIIARFRSQVPPGKLLGAGTVRNLDEAEMAAEAGAMFFVTPNTDTSVIRYANSRRIPVVAGAFTPTEVYAAWAAGAAMVKIFPCGPVGPEYIRDLKGPFEHIPLVAVGGVGIGNAHDYFKAGARAVGVGKTLFGKDALAKHDATALGQNVGMFIEHCNNMVNRV